MTAVKKASQRPARHASPSSSQPARSAHRHAPHEVRIIGGQWKRSKLPVMDLPGLRPTPDRVRETLFNWLGQDLSGWRCLDAFAGTGALGFEAASRGAAQVTLLERDRQLAGHLRQMQARFAATAVQIECADALSWMQRAAPGSYELVFLDPPFEAELFESALGVARPLLSEGGFLYLEANRAFVDASLEPLGLQLWRSAKAGSVHYHLLRPTHS